MMNVLFLKSLLIFALLKEKEECSKMYLKLLWNYLLQIFLRNLTSYSMPFLKNVNYFQSRNVINAILDLL